MLLSGAALLVGQGSGEGGQEAVSVALAAPKGAAVSGYDVTTLTAPADTPFTIAFNNQDPGVQHNVVIASADPAKDPGRRDPLRRRARHRARARSTTRCMPLPDGDYVYYCKVHPTTMKGVLTVAVGRRSRAPARAAT